MRKTGIISHATITRVGSYDVACIVMETCSRFPSVSLPHHVHDDISGGYGPSKDQNTVDRISFFCN